MYGKFHKLKQWLTSKFLININKYFKIFLHATILETIFTVLLIIINIIIITLLLSRYYSLLYSGYILFFKKCNFKATAKRKRKKIEKEQPVSLIWFVSKNFLKLFSKKLVLVSFFQDFRFQT